MLDRLLPPAEKSRLVIGFLPLCDAAPLLVAEQLGLYERVGLEVSLQREISWANVRDKLVSGALDAAQMLAPLPAMATLGISGLRKTLVSSMTLSRNGNGITLNRQLVDEALDRGFTPEQPASLAAFIRQRAQADGKKPTFATVHAFSNHTVLLRKWLRSGGVDPDTDIATLVVPPSQMVDSLDSGIVDGISVGEPWNSVAVQSGVGMIAADSTDYLAGSAEKVLCTQQDWQRCHTGTLARLLVALLLACQWLGSMKNRDAAAALLARPEYLGLDQSLMRPALGALVEAGSREQGGFASPITFYGPGVNRPSVHECEQFILNCTEPLGAPLSTKTIKSLAQASSDPVFFDYAFEKFQQLSTEEYIGVAHH